MKNAVEQRGECFELVAIEGERLSAVTFVQDYVQLHFDGPTVTAITVPFMMAGDARFDPGTTGYRDQLCNLIGKSVIRAYLRPGDRLQIDFSEQVSVVVPLRPESYRAAEAVIFGDGATEQWAAW